MNLTIFRIPTFPVTQLKTIQETDFLLLGKLFPFYYFLIFICSFFGLFWLNRHKILGLIYCIFRSKRLDIKSREIMKELTLLLYPIIFFIVYGFSDFKSSSSFDTPSYKYLFPLFPFIFMIIAIFTYKLIIKPLRRWPDGKRSCNCNRHGNHA